MTYEPTHRSISDGSTVRLVGVVLENEDGERFEDNPSDWEPISTEEKNELPAVTCDNCGWCAKVWATAAPGPPEWICKVCELTAGIDLYREGRNKFHDLLITAFEKLVWMGYPIEDFPGMEPHLLEKTWNQVRDHQSFS